MQFIQLPQNDTNTIENKLTISTNNITDQINRLILEIVSETITNKSSKPAHSNAAQTNNQVLRNESKPVGYGPANLIDMETCNPNSQPENKNKRYESRATKSVDTQTSHVKKQLSINDHDSSENNESKPTNTTAQTNTQVQEDPDENTAARSGIDNTTSNTNMTQPNNEMLVEEERRKNETSNLSTDPDPENGLPYVRKISLESFERPRLQTKYKGSDKCIEKFLVLISYVLVIVFFPCSLFCIFVAVRQYERAVILRNGKVYKNKAFGPGLIHFLPCVDGVKFTDLRMICHAIPHQEALTKNSLTVSVDAVVYYKICDPVCAVINVTNYKKSTQFLAATTLRNAIGTKKFYELLSDRSSVSYWVFQHMKPYAREWGIKIVRFEIKDICLPTQLQKAMAAEAASSRLANAKIIVARSEIDSTRNLQIATTMLMDNPLCMQLRYLQSLQTIAGDKTHTIVFPFSVDFIKKLFK